MRLKVSVKLPNDFVKEYSKYNKDERKVFKEDMLAEAQEWFDAWLKEYRD